MVTLDPATRLGRRNERVQLALFARDPLGRRASLQYCFRSHMDAQHMSTVPLLGSAYMVKLNKCLIKDRALEDVSRDDNPWTRQRSFPTTSRRRSRTCACCSCACPCKSSTAALSTAWPRLFAQRGMCFSAYTFVLCSSTQCEELQTLGFGRST